MRFKSETELARHIVAFLTEHGWEVYAEVQLVDRGGVADIVATQGRLVWIIECKTSFGLAVIEQAARWRGRANFISVAVPGSRSGFGTEVLRAFGIGMLTVGYEGAQEWLAPRLNRRAATERLRKALVPEQKTYVEPGTNSGRRWSPWARTRDAVETYVATHPGVTMKEMLQKVETHYGSTSTARSCLYAWIRAGKFKVYLDENYRPARLYPHGFNDVSIAVAMERYGIPLDQMEAVRARVAARLAS